MNRRQWFRFAAFSSFAGRRLLRGAQPPQDAAAKQGLTVGDYQPKSMLHVRETKVPRARYPVIDWHTHITGGGTPGKKIRFGLTPETCLEVMDRKNIRTMIDLTGGYGDALQDAILQLQKPHPERFLVFTEPAYDRASDPGYAKLQGDLIADAHNAGAHGLKVLKRLGLVLRENGTGPLVRIDDKRFDPMWDAAGSLGMPVAIHTSDPEAFFLPIDR
ncbi:MAG: hypothetical protein JO022_05745, partial [Acidobacteriaceae bacterium]|nr:hypothetical protein [Acidobacteriaceae bacterium]